MKGIRVTKNVKEITFEEVLAKPRVRIKKKFPEAISHRISKTNSTFHVR